MANAALIFCSANDANPFLPYTASTGVDMADADVDELAEIMIHEFGHALGFVSYVLSSFNYIDGAGNFTGPNALSEYNQLVPGLQVCRCRQVLVAIGMDSVWYGNNDTVLRRERCCKYFDRWCL